MEVLLRITEDGAIEVAGQPATGTETGIEPDRFEDGPADDGGLPDTDAFEAVAPPLAFRPEGDPEDPTVDAAAPPRRFSTGP